MKKVFTFLAFVLFGAILIGCSTAKAEAMSVVAIDINPSIELVVENDIVVAANPKNEDGEVLLFELEIVGLNVEVAVEAIIDRAIELGYIDVDSEENIVYVTTLCENEKQGEKLQERLRLHINNAFVNRGVFGVAARHQVMAEMIAEAQELEVPVGLLRLAKIALEAHPEMTLEELLAMQPHDLMQLIKGDVIAIKDMAMAAREQFQEERQTIIDEYQPQFEALREAIHAKLEEIENETDEEALVVLNEELATLQEELAALREAFRLEHEALREEHKANAEALREQIQQANQARKDAFAARMEAYQNQHQAGITQRIRERIQAYQNAQEQKGR